MSSAWFHYETSPIKVRYIMNYYSWASFWVNMCAIVGGMFAMAGIIERMARSTLNTARTVRQGSEVDSPTKISEMVEKRADN